jgi:Tfp pilus assembly protein PilW
MCELKNQKSKIKNRRRRHGLSIAEAVISLVITASLLTAMAAAFVTSGNAVEMNSNYSQVTQQARVTINRMMTEVRQAAYTAVYSDHVDLTTNSGMHIRYQYYPATQQLTHINLDATSNGEHVIASNVTNATFTSDSAPDPKTLIVRVVRVSVTLDLTVGTNEIRLNGCSAPRKSVIYG